MVCATIDVSEYRGKVCPVNGLFKRKLMNGIEWVMSKGVLTFFCGKMGAGKSTKSNELAQQENTVLFSEDDWLAAAYPDQISSLQDYIKYSSLLKPLLKKTIQSILHTGTNVVMDFPANTISQRQWLKSIYSEIDAPHRLVYLELSDEDCLKQIAKRRVQQPDRAKTDTKEMFEQMSQYFVAPSSDEGFNIISALADNTAA